MQASRSHRPPAPPIEVAFPDLSSYSAGNAGIPFAWTFTTSAPGPHLLIQALTHGNEVCGAIALDRLLRSGVEPTRGTLSLVFANVAAYERFDPADPYSSRCVDEDFNRLWTDDVLEGSRDTLELRRARELRPLYDSVDVLLDLHSMSEPCAPLALAGPRAKGLALARAIGVPEHIIVDEGHAAGRRLRDYRHFDDPDDLRNALLVECGQHWERSAPEVAWQAVVHGLRHFEMADSEWLQRELGPDPIPSQKVIEVTHAVTIRSDRFRFTVPVQGLQTIREAETVFADDGGRAVKTPYADCVLIMPTRRPKRGETAVRLGRYRT